MNSKTLGRALHAARVLYIELLRRMYREHPIGWYMGPPMIDATELFEAMRNAKKS